MQRQINGKSCFNCKNADIDPGYDGCYEEPPSPPSAECKLDYDDVWYHNIMDRATDSKIEVEHLLAVMCDNYNPVLIEKCLACKKEMNVTRWDHIYWAYLEDRIPMCSSQCTDEEQKKFKIQMGLQEIEYRKKL